MGWGSGSYLLRQMVEPLGGVVPDTEQRRAVYRVMIVAFQDKDCDTLRELEGEDVALDLALVDESVIGDDEEE